MCSLVRVLLQIWRPKLFNCLAKCRGLILYSSNNNRRSKLRFIIFGACILFVAPLFAVPADDNEPMHITSNTFSGNLNQDTALYQGNVVVTQGTRYLASDQLYIYTDQKGKVSSVKALGAPVKTQEQVNVQGQMAYGLANEVDYFPPVNLVKYQQNVTLTSNGNIFKGDLITYNTVSQLIFSPNTEPGEIDTFILPPQDEENKKS